MRSAKQAVSEAINRAIYSIRDLEKLTGIKAHTIRIWEQRYNLIRPARTETNIRYYTDENLKHLFNIALLNRKGMKISHIAKLPPSEIASRASEANADTRTLDARIDALILAMIDLDEAAFSRIFSISENEIGFQRAMLELVYPFLDRLNLLWLTGSVSAVHDNFVDNLIRRKIICAIEKEKGQAPRDSDKFLLFLPSTENQELTLLFMEYLLHVHRQQVFYFGNNLALPDLRDAAQRIRPQYIFTILNEPPHRQSVQAFVHSLRDACPECGLLLTGAQFFTQPVALPPNTRLLDGLPETMLFLKEKTSFGHLKYSTA